MKKNTTALATAQDTALAAPMNFAEDAGQGIEGADKQSFAIPFIGILQGLSPQLETVEGAKPGLFINTITNEVASELLVIPCAFQRRYNAWAPRESGGGFRGTYNPIEVETGTLAGVAKNTEGRFMVGENELQDTRNHFILVQDESGAWHPALLSLSRTQIKHSKKWLSRIGALELRDPACGKAYNPPSFSHVYKLTTAKESNDKGSWFGLEVNLVAPVTDAELYDKAKKFYKSVTAGDIVVAPPVDTETAANDPKKF